MRKLERGGGKGKFVFFTSIAGSEGAKTRGRVPTKKTDYSVGREKTMGRERRAKGTRGKNPQEGRKAQVRRVRELKFCWKDHTPCAV